jgi:hypothetical protein
VIMVGWERDNNLDPWLPILSPLRYDTPTIACVLIALTCAYAFVVALASHCLIKSLGRWIPPLGGSKHVRRGVVATTVVFTLQHTLFRSRAVPALQQPELALDIVHNVKPEDVAGTLGEYSLRCQPVVIRRGAAHWPAVQRWTPEYLAAQLGPDKTASVSENRDRPGEIVPTTHTTYPQLAHWLRTFNDSTRSAAYTAKTGRGPFYLAEGNDVIFGHPGLGRDAPWEENIVGDALPLPAARFLSHSLPFCPLFDRLRQLFDYESFTSFWWGGVGVKTHWHMVRVCGVSCAEGTVV